VLDPHGQHPESLSKSLPKTSHFVFLDANNPVKGLYTIGRELQSRLDAPNKHSAPVVLCVDELAYCTRQRYAPTLQVLLERISCEGRKTAVYVLASSQDTRVRKSGDFRDTLSSAYLFNIKSGMARSLLQDKEEVQRHGKVRELNEKGVALFVPTEDESRVVRVPYCAPRDMQYIEAIYRNMNSPEKQPEQGFEQSREQDEQVTVHQMFKQRLEQHGISLNMVSKQTGIAKSTLSNFLNGKGNLTPEQQTTLEHTLNSLQKQPEQRAINLPEPRIIQ
jgi:hypothetical protein